VRRPVPRSRRPLLVAGAAAAALVAAASLTWAQGGRSTAPPARDVAAPVAAQAEPVSLATRPTKVLTIVEENRSGVSALSSMPYLGTLSRTYGYTTAWQAVTHPSLPNYLALASGSTYGVKDDLAPSAHPLRGQTVFDQAIARGRTAKTYAESMPSPCSLSSYGRYAVKHNPWAYFSDAASRANCRRNDVPAGTVTAGALRNDVVNGRLPNVGMLIPDMCSDGHDCSSATADGWLRRWLPVIMAGPDYRAGRLAIVVTFDEDDRTAGNRILTTVIAPRTTHLVVGPGVVGHYSWTRYADELVGAPLLRGAATARSMRAPFHL